ncbi:hypothetical protein ACQCLI_23740 [Pseudomonas nitroreducens]|uniref:hypothetical protein n=1 Tax=Pseudomonas nitroreducens TaxID=46680 RepID=UPI000316A95A|nr:hypothetical protein [Pseudomonas nitroreducens]
MGFLVVDIRRQWSGSTATGAAGSAVDYEPLCEPRLRAAVTAHLAIRLLAKEAA